MLVGLRIFAASIVLYGATAGWGGQRWITMPMVFAGVGLLLGPWGSNVLPISPRTAGVEQLTELTLAAVLFADASTLRLHDVRQDVAVPARLSGVGLPLTILARAALACLLFSRDGWPFAPLLR